MALMQTAWFLPVAVSLWCVILAVLVWGYFMAQKPPRGTLAWILQTAPPQFAWAGRCHPLGRGDGLAMAVVALFGGTISFCSSGAFMVDTTDFAQLFLAVSSFLVLPMVTSAATYWLAKSMSGYGLVAGVVALVAAVDVFAPAEPVAVIALTGALLYGYSGQPHRATPWHCLGVLLLLGAVVAVGFHFYAGLILLLLPIVVVMFSVSWEHFRETGHFWRYYTAHLGIFFVGGVATLLACYLPLALVNGLPLLGTVFYVEFYQLVLPALVENLGTIFLDFSLYYAVFAAMTHWPLLLLWLAVVPTLCHGAVGQKGSTALFALVWSGTAMAMWLLTGVTALFFALALAAVYPLGRLEKNGRYIWLIGWIFAAYAAILCIYLFVLY